MSSSWVIGVDYGTDSVRAIIVDVHSGNEIASAVFYYPRWKDGLYCNAAESRFRQHPLDYIEGLEATIRQCLQQAGPGAAANIKAISVDTTGSTPVAVDETGTPLALTPAFQDNPNAMFVLWKDHTALKEAAAINATAATFQQNYLRYVGGIYSSEWFWAKLLHILRADEAVRQATYSWVEHCDWIPFLLSGGKHIRQMKRGICSAGHKALFATEFCGLPPDAFFAAIDPLLSGFTKKLFTRTYTAGEAAGHLCPEWAERLGLSTDVVIGIGAFDAHMGAVGGQIEPYHLSKVMGTSTCDMLVAPMEEMEHKLVKGICGQVPGSVIPGMMGMEAGQSAFGDAYAWFSNVLAWPLQHLLPSSTLITPEIAAKLAQEASARMIAELATQAALIPPQEHDELGIDWLNGRRTPDADQSLKGTLTGLNLASDTPRIFRAVAESTCFGAKAIVERFEREGVPVKGLIGIGGVAKKSPFIMQMMADIMNMPIRIHRSEQTCALGAAMFAATAAGIFPKVEDAMEAMGQGFEVTYQPNARYAGIYENRYRKYKSLGAFTATVNTD
ncbi:ribulokinase [Chitinophaga sp. 22536]|uniref:ribulokinase n=1 Tax=unclassified Chitinophaga TaxID=2619133 RepID=UPI003F84601D